MELFDSVFWLVLGVITLGGFLNAIINVTRNMEYEGMTTGEIIIYFLRDILIGMGAGFAVWLAESAMDNTAGILLITFLFSVGGGIALSQLFRLVGIENQRDLFVKSSRTRVEILEPMEDKLEATQQELQQAKDRLQQAETELAQAKARLSIEEERQQHQNELRDLKVEIARLQDETSPEEDDDRIQEDNDSQQNQQGQQE